MPFSPTSIEAFLTDVRASIDSGKFIPVPRSKNISTLTRIGITWDDAKDEIYALTANDYISGPEIDRNNPSSDFLWIFKKMVMGQLIYIKIKVLYQADQSVKAVSFHIDWQ